MEKGGCVYALYIYVEKCLVRVWSAIHIEREGGCERNAKECVFVLHIEREKQQ